MSQERPWWKSETFGIWVTGAALIAIALAQFLWPPDPAHPMGPRFLSFLAGLVLPNHFGPATARKVFPR